MWLRLYKCKGPRMGRLRVNDRTISSKNSTPLRRLIAGSLLYLRSVIYIIISCVIIKCKFPFGAHVFHRPERIVPTGLLPFVLFFTIHDLCNCLSYGFFFLLFFLRFSLCSSPDNIEQWVSLKSIWEKWCENRLRTAVLQRITDRRPTHRGQIIWLSIIA